jgi:hypothetical protein
LSLVSALGVVTAPGSSAAAFPAALRIAFQQGCDIWLAHPSGSPSVNLTPGTPTTCEVEPSVSYTGRYVLFQRWVGSGWQTWLFDHTTNAIRELNVTENAYRPVFSPVADVLAYQRYSAGTGVTDAFTVNIDGTARKNWTNDVAATGGDAYNGNFRPTWTADGQALIVVRPNGLPSCRVSFGGYDEIHHAQALVRVESSGATTPLVSDPALQVQGGAQTGGTTAYLAVPVPPADSDGYCSEAPPTDPHLFVNGTDIGPATSMSAITPDGDVFFSNAGQLGATSAGGTVAPLFAGSTPAIGTAWTASVDDRADLSAAITGLEAKTKTGEFDSVTVSVANNGPSVAHNVELRFGTPAGTFYTSVTKPPDPWVCSMTTLTLIRCNVASMAVGATAQLTVELLATDPQAKTKLAVKVLSATADPVPANDDAVSYQKIKVAPPPALKKGKGQPPGATTRVAADLASVHRLDFTNRSWPKWYSVDSSQRFWYKTTGYTCRTTGGVADNGWLAATFWIWELGKSGTIRLEMEGKIQPDTYSVLKATRRKTYVSSNFADDAQGRFASLTVAWTREASDSYKLQGTWKFIRKHVYRNVKLKHPVITGC